MRQSTIFLLLSFTTHCVAAEPFRPFIHPQCVVCHSGDMTEGDLDLTNLRLDEANFERWVRIYDRVMDGEIPPSGQDRLETGDTKASMVALSNKLTEIDFARQQREGRSRLRRMNRVDFENTLRDLLSLPALKLNGSLPEDGRSHGFDRLSGALDMSFVHMESYLAAVDKASEREMTGWSTRGGGFKHAAHLAFVRKKNYPVTNLYVSLLQNIGVETDRFCGGTGTMRGLPIIGSAWSLFFDSSDRSFTTRPQSERTLP